MSVDCDVIIVGGGLAGATLAGLLANQGLRSIVLEASAHETRPEIKPDPRALALTFASRRILQSIAAWEQVPANRLGRFRSMQVWDENGDGEVIFDSADICQPALGFIIQQSVLQESLVKSVAAMPGVEFRYDSSLSAIEPGPGAITAVLAGSEKLSASLLVAADGGRSRCRELAGIETIERDYQQQALACLVATTLGHGEVARQRFLSQGPLAFLPMHDAHQCGVVWSSSPEHVQQLLVASDDDFHRQLEQAFDYRLGEITGSQLRSAFPLRRAQAKHYCLQRLALVGDAAHSVHPLAGQGANLGLLDVASLAQLLTEARSANRDIGSRQVLRAYERWRKHENKIMMMTLEGFKYTFENQSGPVPALRNRALDLANSIIPLKHTIMRHAMGLSGDLPEIARGSLA